MHRPIEALEHRRLLDADATLYAVADAYARDGAFASTNFGSAAEVHVKKSSSGYQREGFIKFDLHSLGGEIGSAKLRLLAKLTQGAGGVPLSILGSSNIGWSEGGLNWNNRPATSTVILAKNTISSTAAAFHEFDVTDYVRQQISAGADFVTFVLKNTAGNSSFTVINSDEAAVGRPELRVSTNTPQAPGFIVSEPIVRVPEGASQTFTVRLAAPPAAIVRGGISFSGDANLVADRASLEFTPANWNTPQTVTLNATQDADTRNGLAVLEIRDEAGERPINGVYVVEEDNDATALVASDVRAVVNDAFVHDATATSNYGNSSQLVVKKSSSGYNREAYLRFDISDYIAGAGAKLRVFGKLSQSASAVTTAVYGAADNWSENTLTWNNRPATIAGALATRNVGGTAGQWYEFDVTPFVEQQHAVGADAVTLVLRNLAGNSSYTIFNSRESLSNRPELIFGGASEALRSPAPQARPTAPYQADDVLSWLSIGHSAPLDADRHVGYGIKQHDGWTWFVNNTVQAEYDWGIRRFVLHNPFGTHAGEMMQFDQYLHAQDAGLDWLTDDFVSAWSTWIADHPDAEVIAYIGTLDFEGEKDPDFVRYEAPDQQFLWYKRAMDSLQPLIDSGVNIAFDTGGRYAEGSAPYKMMRLAESLGARIYAEPTPFQAAPYLHDLPAMSLFDPDQIHDSASYLQDEEILIIGALAPEIGYSPEQIVDLARQALDRGLRPAIRISDINDTPIYRGIIRYKKLSDILG